MFGISTRCSRIFCAREAVYVKVAYVMFDLPFGLTEIGSSELCVNHTDVAVERFRATDNVQVFGAWIAVDESGAALSWDQLGDEGRVGDLLFTDLSAYRYIHQ